MGLEFMGTFGMVRSGGLEERVWGRWCEVLLMDFVVVVLCCCGYCFAVAFWQL